MISTPQHEASEQSVPPSLGSFVNGKVILDCGNEIAVTVNNGGALLLLHSVKSGAKEAVAD